MTVLVDVLDECVACGDPVAPGASVCECGERLIPHQPEIYRSFTAVAGCTCGGNGVCLPCVFAEYEGDLR